MRYKLLPRELILFFKFQDHILIPYIVHFDEKSRFKCSIIQPFFSTKELNPPIFLVRHHVIFLASHTAKLSKIDIISFLAALKRFLMQNKGRVIHACV